MTCHALGDGNVTGGVRLFVLPLILSSGPIARANNPHILSPLLVVDNGQTLSGAEALNNSFRNPIHIHLNSP